MSTEVEVHQHHPGVELWQQAGNQIPAGASPSQALEAAGFYRVEERDVLIAPSLAAVTDRKALVRADSGQYLATVGKKYQVVQFDSVFRTIVEAGAQLNVAFRAAGTFGPGGVRAWMLGELPDPIVVRGDQSPLKKYVLGVAGHDGMTAVLLKNTALRIWCANSIGAALGSAGGAWRIHHTSSAPQRLDEVSRGIRVVQASFDKLGELANQLAITAFSEAQMREVVNRLIPVADDELDHTRAIQGREKMLSLFENGVGVTAAIRGTCWAAVNAAVEFFDFHRPTRNLSGQSAVERRLESQWIGSGAAKKEVALAAIAEVAGVQLGALTARRPL